MSEPTTPRRLAQVLATRHSDIGFIHAYVRREFGRTVPREQIEAMRAEYLAAKQREEDRHDRCVRQMLAQERRRRLRQANKRSLAA